METLFTQENYLTNYLNYPVNYLKQMNRSLTKKIIIKKGQIKVDGTTPLYLQVFVNKRRKLFPLGISVAPKLFDKKKQRIKGSSDLIKDYNLIIGNELSKINDIVVNYRLRSQILTLDLLCKELNNPASRLSFIKFYEANLEDQFAKKMIKITTYRQQNATLNKLKEFKKEIFFHEINQNLIDDFCAHLKRVKKNNSNTIYTALKNFKKYLHLANKEKIVTPISYSEIKVKTIKGNRTFLEASELNLMYKYYKSEFIKPAHKNVLKKFLFSCFTGIRISDIQKLNQNNFIGEFLVFTAQKGNKLQKIPLNKTARKFINTEDSVFDDGFTDQTINDYLKQIANICGIIKKITFHVSRHTFATQFLISGGKLEVLKELMGHSKIETTMIYVHIVDQHLNQQIYKMDDIFKV